MTLAAADIPESSQRSFPNRNRVPFDLNEPLSIEDEPPPSSRKSDDRSDSNLIDLNTAHQGHDIIELSSDEAFDGNQAEPDQDVFESASEIQSVRRPDLSRASRRPSI